MFGMVHTVSFSQSQIQIDSDTDSDSDLEKQYSGLLAITLGWGAAYYNLGSPSKLFEAFQ